MGMLLSRTTVRVQLSYKKWLPLGHFVLLVSRGVQVRNHHIYREIDHCEQEVRLLLHNGTGRDMCGSQRDPLGVSWCSPAPLELWTDTNGHIWQTQPKKGMITKGSDSQEMTVCTTSSGKPLGDWQVWEESKMGYWRRRWAPLAALGSTAVTGNALHPTNLPFLSVSQEERYPTGTMEDLLPEQSYAAQGVDCNSHDHQISCWGDLDWLRAPATALGTHGYFHARATVPIRTWAEQVY